MDHPTRRKLHAAGRVTLGDSTSLITTYRATVNVVTAKIKPTLVYNDPKKSKSRKALLEYLISLSKIFSEKSKELFH